MLLYVPISRKICYYMYHNSFTALKCSNFKIFDQHIFGAVWKIVKVFCLQSIKYSRLVQACFHRHFFYLFFHKHPAKIDINLS